MAVHEIRVSPLKPEDDILGRAKSAELSEYLGIDIQVSTQQVFYLEGGGRRGARQLRREPLFAHPLTHKTTIDSRPKPSPYELEIGYKAAVMVPEAESIVKAARNLGVPLDRVATSTHYSFSAALPPEELADTVRGLGMTGPLINSLVQTEFHERPNSLYVSAETRRTEPVELIGLSDQELVEMAKWKLHMSVNQLKAEQSYFERKGRNPTDVEQKITEAWWSEHCGHTTFKADVLVNGEKKKPLFTRIKEAAKEHFGELVVTAFEDNSGGIRFYEGQVICGKVETHNSPSALEPRGGSMTGSGGVFRDVLGTGQGAKVIGSTDMFCFAPPDMDSIRVPTGCLDPNYLLKEVVGGVRDYGNPTGIPTNNGSVHFDEGFRAKPTVIVGGYGILPEERAQKGQPEVGDLVIAIGGKTGRDGIGGATYSSRLMTYNSSEVDGTIVQIGNPIEEKRVMDAVLAARDQNLIRALTDCGAAGFSSAVGELGKDTGVEIDLKLAPLKYQGLSPWEILLSESQERMVLAIPADKRAEFLTLCQGHNVEATVLGNFTDSNKFVVKYGENNIVAELDYEFLENGQPRETITAEWTNPEIAEVDPGLPIDWETVINNILADYNVCSKEPIVRQYDHTVQGTNVTSPYAGENGDGPNDAAVITPILGKNYGMVTSHGMNPKLMELDPYQGSIWATAEAMANYVAMGGDPSKCAWINNYIWPSIHQGTMGSLDRSVDAVVDCMNAFGIPVISGKDSLSSTYRAKDGSLIEIPPVLCMSVFGGIEDVNNTVSADIKNPGSTLCLVGSLDAKGMGGSVYYEKVGGKSSRIPQIDLQSLPGVVNSIHNAVRSGNVKACHDVSEGGIIAAVAEMCFGGNCGVEITLNPEHDRPDQALFSETAGCFIVEIDSPETAQELFGNVPYQIIGRTTEEKNIKAQKGAEVLFNLSTDQLKESWKRPMERIFS